MAEGYGEVLASIKQRPPEKDALLSLVVSNLVC